MYALEPCNQLIQLHPDKPAARQWMRAWDEAAIEKGLDPFIGTKVAGELHKMGFEDVRAKFHPVAAMGDQRERYDAIVGNLKGFYLGPGAAKLGLDPSAPRGRRANREFDARRPGDLVMDALFVSWGTKGA